MTDVTATTAVAQAPAGQKKPRITQRQKAKFVEYHFVVPALVLLEVFNYYTVAKLVQIR